MPNNKNPSEDLPVTSSVPTDLPMKQETLFSEVLTVLEAAKVPYAVSGAFALRQHTGICRDTKDLDIFLTVENARVALRDLERYGFECEIRDPVWLAKANRDGYFVDLITGMSNGLISVEDSWIQRAHSAKVLGVGSRVLAPEELLASKLFVVRRERFDGADIAHIIYASRGNLQWDRIMELAGEHWEMLLWAFLLYGYVYPAHRDYVPLTLWQKLLARFQESVFTPDPSARFRGSLIDEKMFAIDMDDWGLADLLTESRARRSPITKCVETRTPEAANTSSS
jgi:nucleotidyltransferase DUF2204